MVIKFQYTCNAGLAVFMLASALDCIAQPLIRADRPEMKVGDTWMTQGSERNAPNRELTTFVKAVYADKFVLETGRGQLQTYTRDWNVTERKTGDTVSFLATPNWTFYQFPLEVGKEWQAEWETDSARGKNRYKGKTRVESSEDVTVAAGTFKAFKLRSEAYYTGYSGGYLYTGRYTQTVWYAPDVKHFVKSESETSSPSGGGGSYYNSSSYELKSFKLVQ